MNGAAGYDQPNGYTWDYYDPGYNGAPPHGYINGLSASLGVGPIRTPSYNKGYRQAPYPSSDNDHKRQ